MKVIDCWNVLAPSITIILGASFLSQVGTISWMATFITIVIFIIGQLVIYANKKKSGLTKTTSISCFFASTNIISEYVLLNGVVSEFISSVFMLSLGLYFFLLVVPAVSTRKDILFYR